MISENHLPPLSAAQLTIILDNVPVALFVSAVDNKELLYFNDYAKETFLRTPYHQGITCYQAAGFKSPCPFCHTSEMDHSNLLAREFQHPDNNQIYQLSGKLIDWDGRLAHIEYIIDITDKKKSEHRTEKMKQELQAIFSNIPCGLSVYRFVNGNIFPLFHNSTFYEIMGYSKEHIQLIEQETNYLGVHPNDLPSLQKKIQTTIQFDGILQHTYRVWNDIKSAYSWIQLDGSVKSDKNGNKLLYGVYRDVNEQVQLRKELILANEKMQDTINAIPGGVVIYKIADKLETIYFSDGIPVLLGYTTKEYQDLIKHDAFQSIYADDITVVIDKANEVVQSHEIATFEFRKVNKDHNIIWVRVQMKWLGTENDSPLLHCVFHNISDLKEAKLEMDHLVNSIPGGIASYRIEEERFIPTFYSDGLLALSGHTREEFTKIVQYNALEIIYESDRERVFAAARAAIESEDILDISYRMRHKNGNLIWIHLNGRRMQPISGPMRFYAVLTGMSAESRLFQNVANSTADGIYVIDKKNYELLYTNLSTKLFSESQTNFDFLGEKCYSALYGMNAPCKFCTLQNHLPDGKIHTMEINNNERCYTTQFQEIDWNGIPAYIKYVWDVTEEVKLREEKERLEEYFQTLVKHLPGGVGVVRHKKDGSMIPEFLSEGFAAMTGMSLDNAWHLYQKDAMAGVHPEDKEKVMNAISTYLSSNESQREIIYRLQKGNDDYIWVKNTLFMIQNNNKEEVRVYAVYYDITKEREKQEHIRQQYKDLILQHYHAPSPDSLIMAHCNITQGFIYNILDYTHSNLGEIFGIDREIFFNGISNFILDAKERQQFLQLYLKKPALEAFSRGDFERRLSCFVQLPKESKGRYVQIKMNMVVTPDSGDITGILTITDITEQVISERIMQQLSVSIYDCVIDLDLTKDYYTLLSYNENSCCLPSSQGCHSEWTAYMLSTKVVPKDQEQYKKGLDLYSIPERLQNEGPYTFAYSVLDDFGDIRTKNITVYAVDLRLGRICLSRTDITDSIREQQGLLNVIASTFELAGFIDLNSRHFTMYTKDTVLKNLAPFSILCYDDVVPNIAEQYGTAESREIICKQLYVENILERLKEKPTGYDFLLSYQTEKGERYKQINILWGDVNHKTICVVRADVTDMLAAERQAKKELENALTLAESANHAKSDFLSAMSHDIRTPLNAIMGMTTLATSHLDNQVRVADCLNKISISSKHLLSLINDVLDMSKIEHASITLNHVEISLSELIEQLSTMILPQAELSGLQLHIIYDNVQHKNFYGDPLRINQILINILSNAIKFTPEGGTVEFSIEEITPKNQSKQVCYRFTISDTGIGMSEKFLKQAFSPFTRDQNVALFEGTGLGLSITKGLVDLMGGKISVNSQLNKGSSFCVELEFEIVQKNEQQDQKISQPGTPMKENSFKNYCFLVAEDNALNAEILCELLKICGAKSVVKTTGAQAVKEFQNAVPYTYNAILMDIQMPEMNGYEATRIIRKMSRPDAKTIPIIAMTANAFAEDIQASLDAGMNAHVAKPIDTNLLQITLNNVLLKSQNKK